MKGLEEKGQARLGQAKQKPSVYVVQSPGKMSGNDWRKPGGRERSEGFILADLRPLTWLLGQIGKIPYNFSCLSVTHKTLKGDRKISTEKLHNL